MEHHDSAVRQGAIAAQAMLGRDVVHDQPHWFWSDQYDRKIQLAGRVRPDDDVEIVTGSPEEQRFAALYGRRGMLVGVLGFNRPRHVMQYKTMIENGTGFTDAVAAEI